ncbi:MAG: 16S rRNA (adenine(1518)-N(6)/adenine(1519)-N(6))-dimethyltransferase RsmA [Candidatus Adiutrix sp.]|jgi:16S rRNA (adenine1518-N6/adenine1519-N6)-dimethyltransferase|nr:16S rRNA (adenine(1518)-N(6)/adenine(1519)-N(6))-dimethyltransferase RsmA [Candidatus Adiutrix sp.]
MAGPPVRTILKALGLRPAKSRGQNFLKDEGVIRRLVKEILAAAEPVGRRVLEIGPGLGALTWPLLAAGAEILAVELDRGLAENLAAAGSAGLTVIHRDILTVDPAEFADPRPRFLCGNLPYNIAGPALFWFLRHRRAFSGALVMLQKEMADRLTAGPGTRAYGRLAVALGLWCRIDRVLAVPPAAFHPRPKVAGAVVRLRPVPPLEEPPLSAEALGRFTQVAFSARRQTLLNNLARVYDRPRAAEVLAGIGLAPGLRAEQLSPPALAALALALEPARSAATALKRGRAYVPAKLTL